ncbi:CopG family transcriptional regulator [Nonomuraea typhae]|uniref:ribbon-helix-helix domain-containing protein n=1 Tax=Nonomuraea typhae TaxID=2603600 RepID=UPI0012F8A411|nr:CopG family transcriptional regulator [Nonomuraea typhae]
MSLYLPEDLKQRVAQAARVHGMSEDEYMRDAIRRTLDDEATGQAPRWGLFDSGDPTLASRTDEILAEGFGER